MLFPNLLTITTLLLSSSSTVLALPPSDSNIARALTERDAYADADSNDVVELYPRAPTDEDSDFEPEELYHALERRRGGGGGGGGRGGGGGGGGGSRSSSSSSSSGSSSGDKSGSSSTSATSRNSNSGGYSSTGTGTPKTYGSSYAGGSSVPYTSGSSARSPSGLRPGTLIPLTTVALIMPGLWLYSVYPYHFSQPGTFLNRTASPAKNETLDILCLCQEYSVCGCDEKKDNDEDKAWLQEVWDNRTTSDAQELKDGNASYASRVADYEGKTTLVINGTLENGTTAAGAEASSSGGMAAAGGRVGGRMGWGGCLLISTAVAATVALM